MSRILFVFEGGRAENQIGERLKALNLIEQSTIFTVYGENIYTFYRQCSEDEFLDTFTLLKNRHPNQLEGFGRNDFSELYFFFDYDGHDRMATDEQIVEMLEFFRNETEEGKLYISYPMLEAIKHLADEIDFKELVVAARTKINYKNLVGNEASSRFQNLTTWELSHWREVAVAHLRKMNYVVYRNFSWPQTRIDQLTIFESQQNNYLNRAEVVAVLSGYPPMLADYYGLSALKEKLGLSDEAL
ncbi:hypothetical protein [Saprospira grandis]|uniref:hypothetical protein n=1 Tax=Saprospira grandis TaxID=1008 RepID=UPI0022DDBFE3|nr:hypothetical protein [Saprospira grandis]WBM73908.1 hypothetical protein OP864_13025 [Saprospira grandis]